MKRPVVNMTDRERAGRILVGALAVLAGIALIGSGPALATVLEALLILAGLDLVVSGASGFCPLYHWMGRTPRSTGRPT